MKSVSSSSEVRAAAEAKEPRWIKVYNFYDSKAESFSLQPMFYETVGLARRAIAKSVNQPGTGFNENPEDYTFFETGRYDMNSGKIETYDAPVSLGVATTFVQSS